MIATTGVSLIDEKSKLDLGKERVVSIRSSLSETSSNSVQNGSENFI